tara:strand:+ start:19406 stop:19996 length:591 start_codon:yes stop_codon:yes gene_type:complete
MKVKQYKIDQLIEAEYNPRQLTQRQYQNLRDSIQRFGIVDPILINTNKDRKNIIIGGHQRIHVAKVLDIKEVPCVELDLTVEQEKELNIRLNKNTGKWDYDILANLFDMEDLKGWGFEEFEFGEIEPEIDESILDDYDVDEQIDGMNDNARKSIQIAFRNELYPEAKQIVKDFTNKDIDIDIIIYEALKNAKNKTK